MNKPKAIVGIQKVLFSAKKKRRGLCREAFEAFAGNYRHQMKDHEGPIISLSSSFIFYTDSLSMLDIHALSMYLK